MTEDTTPRIEVTIAAPVDAVWDALRDKEKIRHWHGWDFEGLAEEIDLIYFQHFTADPQARTLGIQGGDLIELEPDGEHTRVRLTRAARGGDPEWDAYYEDVTEGWITFLHQLKYFLERRPGAVRRTLFFSGTAGGAGPVVEELGLAELTGGPGTPFTGRLAGQDVKGQVWFRSDHQLGVTVDAWGEGLLVLAHIPPSDAKPQGAAMAVLSTYGLDDATYGDLERRWTAWWTPRYAAEASHAP